MYKPAVRDGKYDFQLEKLFLIYRTRTEVQPPPNGYFFCEKKLLISNRNNHVTPNCLSYAEELFQAISRLIKNDQDQETKK